MACIRRIINTIGAPKAVGPYNQAVMVDQTLYMSGQIGLEPTSGVMAEGGVEAEAHQVFKNMQAVLASVGGNFSNIVKSTVLLTDMKDYPTVNTIYAQYFKEPYPARAAFAVAGLPKGAKVEIEAIAVLGEIVDK
ncbi:unnamed protein product [Owenia fusiformis]|uniref:Uncharacterized protein n=1 Tax=Owenia fusiformis TaxID=6347 RepID=A0A8J1U8B2_OWEFU|nr:unnamed protein product [Owenia fusiformis]